jgi:poly-beta-1,6-N-acetyl-D-glucosamine synthase
MSTLETIAVGICGVYVIYILLFSVLLALSKRSSPRNTTRSVTIVVPFRNEKDHLDKLLKSFTELDYPMEQIEVVLVNDHSSDGSEYTKLEKFSFDIRLIHCEKEGKKAALTEGINQASNDIIVQTDADCIVPTYWLSTIIGELENCDMVCGIVLFSNSSMQNLELFTYHGVGKASLMLNSPILANGANMAYRKSDFIDMGGYKDNTRTSSGDDVFLLRSFAKNKKSIVYTFSPNACVSTTAEKSLAHFFKQRVRWAGKTGRSRHLGTILAGIILLSTNLFVVFQIVTWMIYGFAYDIGLMAFLSKFAIDILFLFLVALSTRVYRPLLYLPIAITLYSLYIVLLAILCVFYRPEWKNRKIQI